MTVEKWREVLNSYQAAILAPRDRRREFLASTTDDPEVIEKALRMLEALDQDDGEPTAAAPVAEEAEWTGSTVGRYNVAAPLGHGGTGDVYLGWDTVLDRRVALKFLTHERAGVPAAIAKFVREAKAASALNHPNIVTVHEAIQTRRALVIVMELVEGHAARTLCGTPAPLDTLLSVGRQTALALAAAHAHGIVHRDVKPENIMVRTDGYVKLVDFGLARRLSLAESTNGGLPAGTLRYMSPEQIRGDSPGPASDIFSLGLVLYELAAGRHPFAEYPAFDSAAAILSEPVPGVELANPSLPARLTALIGAMLSKESDRRPAAAEVAATLHDIGESSAIGYTAGARPSGGARQPWVWRAAMVGLLGIGALYGSYRLGLPRQSEPPELRSWPLTSQAGWEAVPSFSPDGETLAFTWTPAPNQTPQMYAKRLDADTSVQLTHFESGVIGPIAWSPDGNTIAFSFQSADGKSGAIYRIPAKGGQAVKLIDLLLPNLSSSLDWSPDGTQIVFSDAPPGTGQLALYAFHPHTGEKRKLTSPPAEDWGDWDPKLSPDGKTLAFKRVRGYWLDAVYLMPAAGGPIRRITKDSRSIWGHTWTPNGDGLIVSIQATSTIFGLWRFPVTSGQEPVRISEGWLDAIRPTSDRRRGRIAWVNHLEDVNIYRIPLTGNGDPTEIAVSTRRDEGPNYAPDGRLAFASDRSGSLEIWIASSDVSNPVRVTDFRGPLTGFPRWSPDGRYLAFESATPGGRGGIFVLECPPGGTRCGEPRRLTTGTETFAENLPSWSADGESVYFASNRTGSYEIWKQALPGGEALQVTRHGGFSSQESRDGRWLYFMKLDQHSIWRMPGSRPEQASAAAQERLLIGLPGERSANGWILTSDEILFVGVANDKAIYGYRLDSGEIRTIAPLLNLPGRRTDLAVSPDLQWLLYTQLARFGSNIMVADFGR